MSRIGVFDSPRGQWQFNQSRPPSTVVPASGPHDAASWKIRCWPTWPPFFVAPALESPRVYKTVGRYAEGRVARERPRGGQSRRKPISRFGVGEAVGRPGRPQWCAGFRGRG